MSRTALACALCLLIAGCAAPTAPTGTQSAADAATTDSEAPTTSAVASAGNESTTDDTDETNDSATASTDIAVSGGSLPVDHERVFARTVGLLGANVSPPSVVVVESQAEIREGTGEVGNSADNGTTRTFVGVVGIGRDGDDEEQRDADGDAEGDGTDGSGADDRSGESEENDAGVSVAAYAPSAYSVVVNERVTAAGHASLLERTLAHEFVHTVQFRQQAFDRMRTALDAEPPVTRDTYLTYVSVVEGAAAFVADVYDRRYLAGEWASVTTTERYRSSPSGVKYSIARYYFGRRYLDARFDSPRNVSAVYDDPPRTTEQLLHYRPDATDRPTAADRPKPLALTVTPGENRTLGRTNVNGELFTRIALGTELNESRAAEAAAGWGADRLVSVEAPNRPENRSFVWATRWDSPAEADEFEAALGAYLDSRATHSEGVWRDGPLAFRAVRVDDETVALLAGAESFVGAASVSGTNASVSVSPDGR